MNHGLILYILWLEILFARARRSSCLNFWTRQTAYDYIALKKLFPAMAMDSFASRKISIVIGWSLTPVEQMSLKDRQTGGLKVVKVWLEEICLQELWGWWTPAFVGQRLKGLLLLQSNRTGWRDGGFLRVQVCLDLILGASCLGIHGTCTVDGAEIRQAPVEVGSLSHYLQGFIYPKRCRISSINSMFIYV